MTGTQATGARMPWLASYPPDVPPTHTAARASLLAHFREAVESSGERGLIYSGGSLRTYADVDRTSDALSVWLIEQGVRSGDRVGVILQNVPELVIAVLATWKCGAIPVPGNPMYQSRELARIFADCRPAAMMCHAGHRGMVEQGLAEARLAGTPCATVAAADEPPPRADHDVLAICAAKLGQTPPAVSLAGDDVGLIMYTSGTTGTPKGAMISHGSMAFNSEANALWMRVGANSRVLAIAPLFHITGFTLHLGVTLVGRCSMALQGRFQADSMLRLIRDYRPTFTVGAITAFNALMNADGAAPADFASLDTVFCGGAPIAPALREAVKERLGIALQPAYGLTETAAATHAAPPDAEVPVDEATGALSTGLPICSTSARIVGPDGRDMPVGSPGEIWIRGPQLMLGYWNKPEETSAVLADGWLRTGDVGVMDAQGWFYIVDRLKDVIVASGFKVWPREVEDALAEHPAVREAAVVGAPDDYRGETVIAYVSLRPESAVDGPDLIEHCRTRLAAYKVPTRVTIMEELPKTATGKIQRAMLRECGTVGRGGSP